MNSLLSDLFAAPAGQPDWQVDLLRALGCEQQGSHPQEIADRGHAPPKLYNAPPMHGRRFDETVRQP